MKRPFDYEDDLDSNEGSADRYESNDDHGHRIAPSRLDDYDPQDRYDDVADLDDEYEDQNQLDRDAEEESQSRLRRRQHHADAQELIARVIDLVASARESRLSASVAINKDEVLELLEEAQQRLPDELREARWLRKERDEYLEKARADGDEIIEHARARVEQMVQRAEIVKAAEHRARRLVEGAQAEARRLRLECEDYCDRKLAGFEIVLERTLKSVIEGRDRLQRTGIRQPESSEFDDR